MQVFFYHQLPTLNERKVHRASHIELDVEVEVEGNKTGGR